MMILLHPPARAVRNLGVISIIKPCTPLCKVGRKCLGLCVRQRGSEAAGGSGWGSLETARGPLRGGFLPRNRVTWSASEAPGQV